MLCSDGKLSLRCYLFTIITYTALYIPENNINCYLHANSILSQISSTLCFFIIVNIILFALRSRIHYEVAIRATFLGFIFATGINIYKTCPANINIFGIYMCIMSFFHYSEYLSIAIIQPNELGTNSFLLYHSNYYVIAAVTSWIEFFTESYTFPTLKEFKFISYIGIVICVVGEFLRKLAMLTAKSNFNHLVQYTKADDHSLVTNGIYSLCRHPSYVGWFYWSIGTQIVLLNPICFIAYAVSSWMFFNERVKIEEITLLNFFGQQYCDYQQNVGTGLPFINGYLIKS